MLEIVTSIIFKLIAILGTVILTPVYAILSPIFGVLGFADYLPYMYEFLDTCFTYAGFFVFALHIPLAPLIALVSLCGFFITFNITVRAVMVIRNIYLAVKGG